MVREPESICWPSISRNKAHLATLGATCHLKSAQELPSVALLGVGAVRSSSPDGGPVGYQTLQSSETGVKINIWNLSLYSRDLLCVLSEFSCVMSDSTTPWTAAHQSPLPTGWGSPGKNTGVGHHALFQEIFLTQGSNPQVSYISGIGRRFFTTSATWEAHSKDTVVLVSG